jgi:hypothetical protein
LCGTPCFFFLRLRVMRSKALGVCLCLERGNDTFYSFVSRKKWRGFFVLVYSWKLNGGSFSKSKDAPRITPADEILKRYAQLSGRDCVRSRARDFGAEK